MRQFDFEHMAVQNLTLPFSCTTLNTPFHLERHKLYSTSKLAPGKLAMKRGSCHLLGECVGYLRFA